jgi:hypothetical protein
MTQWSDTSVIPSGGDLAALIESEGTESSGSQAIESLSVLQPLVRSMLMGSAGLLMLGSVPCYASSLPRYGTSPLVIDERPTLTAGSTTSVHRAPMSLSAAEQVRELLAALALNKSQMADVLRVSRPTLYDWLEGKEPAPGNAERIDMLCGLLVEIGVTSRTPLNARFVRRPLGMGRPSLLEILAQEDPTEGGASQILRQALELSTWAQATRAEREDRLRNLGYEDPTDDERRDTANRNVAMLNWPKR